MERNRNENITENKVIIDRDLIIENIYLHSPHQKFTFLNSASYMINITMARTKITNTELKFNGSNIYLLIENSLFRSSHMYLHGFTQSNHQVVIHSCRFDEDTDIKNNTVRQTFLSFKGTNIEFYSCNFTGLKYGVASKNYIDCSFSNITMMDLIVRGIEGNFTHINGCIVQTTHSYFRENNGSVFIGYVGILKIKNSHFLNNTVKSGTISLKDSIVHVINSQFTSNEGQFAGGIYLYYSTAHIVNCKSIQNNGKYAGGIYLHHSEAHVIISTLIENQGEHGGGICLHANSEAHVINSTLIGNQGERSGGIYVYNSQAHVINSALTRNKGNIAGGIYLFHSQAYVIDSTLTGNNGEKAGGIYLYKSEGLVINNTLIGNKGERAGGIGMCYSKAHVINSSLTGNRARDCGALRSVWNSHVKTNGCHFLENVATDKGAAIFLREGQYKDYASVFADNVAGEGGMLLKLIQEI